MLITTPWQPAEDTHIPLGGRSHLGAPCGQLLLHKRQQGRVERLGHLVVGAAQQRAANQVYGLGFRHHAPAMQR